MILSLCLAGALTVPALALTTPTAEVENAAPIAEDLTLKTYKGVAISSRFAAVDPEGDLVTFQVVDSPARGQVAMDENDPAAFTYTPYEGKKGRDTFTYVAIDAKGNMSKPATVKVTIQKQSTTVSYSDLEGDPAHYAALRLAEAGVYTGRKVGDGASNVVMEQLRTQDPEPKDHLCYLTKTPDGKILKSSTVYIRDRKGRVSAILAINYDISALLMVENAIGDLTRSTREPDIQKAERITVLNVGDVLDRLIEQSVALAGKPVALMNKDDRMRAVRFLNEHGAFLITKSSDKVAKFFGISKYTLYSYIDSKQEDSRHEQD